MFHSNIKTSQHDWSKTNLVTLIKNGRHFDEMVCSQCGMKGRRYGFESVTVSGSYKIENVNLCPKAKPTDLPKKVEVIKCMAHGVKFSNLKPKSIHEVVTPPEGYKNDHSGVWVMGVGEPVKLLSNEFRSLTS